MNFYDLIKQTGATAYPEPESQIHGQLIPEIVSKFSKLLKPNAAVLDVGFGNGLSLREFKKRDVFAIGLSILQSEVDSALAEGLSAECQDMHLPVLKSFDGIFARHILEHSPCPFLVLMNFRECMNDGGWLYVEVPLPGTASKHELNANHYSMLPQQSWAILIDRAGFKIEEAGNYKFENMLGLDSYFFAIARKV